LIEKLPRGATVLPVQTLGELFSVFVRKARRSPASARAAILDWRDSFPLIATSATVLTTALDLSTDYQVGIWDAVILSAAAEAGCRLLLSEDLQDGFTWNGATITNPFSPLRNRLLEGLLQESGDS
jgi:predicted nucleic acid-binding protein